MGVLRGSGTETKQLKLYIIFNKERPLVKPRSSGGLNKKEHHQFLSGIIKGVGLFYNYWCT